MLVMPASVPQVIPANSARAIKLSANDSIKLINTHGSQVVDTWAFSASDAQEFMSMEHSRVAIQKVTPSVGDVMVTNRRNPILTFIEDTSPGIHDILIAACDRYRYEQLGCKGYHPSCTENLFAALKVQGITPPAVPSPWNMWMNVSLDRLGGMSFKTPVSKKGDYVLLRAECDLYIIFSCCPQDMIPINGLECASKECHFQMFSKNEV